MEERVVTRKARQFQSGTRGKMIESVLKASNDKTKSFSKLSVDIALFLITRGTTKSLKSQFYKDLHTLAEKVADYSGRESVPTKGAMSLALKRISEAGLYNYQFDMPANKEKHGDRRGIRLSLIEIE